MYNVFFLVSLVRFVIIISDVFIMYLAVSTMINHLSELFLNLSVKAMFHFRLP